jgi:hypothetical protein
MNKLIVPLIIILAAVMRLLPHPPNFTPIIAIGLFGGAYIKNRSLGILIPITAMFISDLFLGFHNIIYWVYGSLFMIVLIGTLLHNKVNLKNCIAASLSGSFLFFFVTNFGVWFTGAYPKSMEGFLACYTLALPFFGNTLAGTMFYSGVLFGGYELIKRNFIEISPDYLQN